MAYKRKTTDGVRGRPTKLTQSKVELALMLRDRGFSLKEIATALGVDESVLYFKGTEWEILRSQLNAIKAKQNALKVGKVSKALYNRAIGQKVTTVKQVLDKDGSIVELKEVKELPGEVKAQQFFLINRDPENWSEMPKDNQDEENNDKSIKIEIVEEKKKNESED